MLPAASLSMAGLGGIESCPMPTDLRSGCFSPWLRCNGPNAVRTVAAVFLASPASNYVNGQIIYVNGGLLAVL